MNDQSQRLPLGAYEERHARNLYGKWFRENPKVKNPSDVNSSDKFNFAMDIGWPRLALMQKARKANTGKYGYPYPWTKWEYWEGKQ